LGKNPNWKKNAYSFACAVSLLRMAWSNLAFESPYFKTKSGTEEEAISRKSVRDDYGVTVTKKLDFQNLKRL
jgi:hypothetical protein